MEENSKQKGYITTGMPLPPVKNNKKNVIKIQNIKL